MVPETAQTTVLCSKKGPSREWLDKDTETQHEHYARDMAPDLAAVLTN